MRLLVKLCGLRTTRDVEAAVEAGANAVGLVLGTSPRRVSWHRAAELLAAVPAGIERVAVFSRATRADFERARELGFHALQAEAPSAPRGPLRDGLFFVPVLRDGADLEERLEALHLPTPRPGRVQGLRGTVAIDGPRGGGQGLLADERRARALSRRVRLVLAGGLDPDNVAARILAVRPAVVDVSSGIESRPAHKDPARMRAFVAAARAAALELERLEEAQP